MASLLFLALLLAGLAMIGRLSTPRHERLPVLGWTVRDAAANIGQGVRFLLTCSDRTQTLVTGLRIPRGPDGPTGAR